MVAAVLEGPRAVAAFRQLAGGTDPVEKATPGTIRGDFGLETQFNLVHGSDSRSLQSARSRSGSPPTDDPGAAHAVPLRQNCPAVWDTDDGCAHKHIRMKT